MPRTSLAGRCVVVIGLVVALGGAALGQTVEFLTVAPGAALSEDVPILLPEGQEVVEEG